MSATRTTMLEPSLSPLPVDLDCDGTATPGGCDHLHLYGRCADFCIVSSELVGVPRSGATVTEHGAWCYGNSASAEAVLEDMVVVDVLAELVRPYHHGTYDVEALLGTDPREYRGTLVRLSLWTGSAVEIEPRPPLHLSAAEARRLGLILLKLADRVDGLDKL